MSIYYNCSNQEIELFKYGDSSKKPELIENLEKNASLSGYSKTLAKLIKENKTKNGSKSGENMGLFGRSWFYTY